MFTDSIRKYLTNIKVSIVLGATSLLLIFSSFMVPSTHALTLDLDARDCDDNAVIRCGAASTEGLLEKYNNDASVRAIFNHFGISAGEMSRIGTTAKSGIVDKDGRVTVGDNVVATGAITAGRQNMSGSTAVNVGGTTFYKRPPSVSFQTNRLKAFVVMDSNNQFAFAIIASCGNPVTAHPKPKPTPPAPTKPTPQPKIKPQPQPPAPQPAPQPQQNQSQNQSQQQSSTANANASVTVNQPPAPAPTVVEKQVVEKVAVPAPAPVAAAQPVAAAPVQELPKTGIDDVGTTLGVAGLATLAGTIVHILYSRRKLRQS